MSRDYFRRNLNFDPYEELRKDNPYCLIHRDFISKWLKSKLSSKGFDIGDTDHINTFTHILASTYLFYISNGKIFKLEKDITELLLHTDLYNVEASLLKIPFDSIYISVPLGLIPYVSEIDGTLLYVSGIYIHITDELNEHVPDYISKAFSDKSCLLMYTNMVSSEYSSLPDNPFEYEYSFLGLPFERGKDIFPQLRDYLAGLCGHRNNRFEGLFSFIINTIL